MTAPATADDDHGASARGEDDIGGTAIYLASRASRYMSGAYLVLDGGVVAQA